MKLHLFSIDSPIGPLRLLVGDDAVHGLYLPGHKGAPAAAQGPALDRKEGERHPVVVRARAQLGEYFDGRRRSFDVPLSLEGTDFQQQVWAALLRIPFGETRSYAALSAALGKPRAVRAVGAANGRNPVSILVPCHRVVGSDGSLTGYAGGPERKRWLLCHEGVSPFVMADCADA